MSQNDEEQQDDDIQDSGDGAQMSYAIGQLDFDGYAEMDDNEEDIATDELEDPDDLVASGTTGSWAADMQQDPEIDGWSPEYE